MKFFSFVIAVLLVGSPASALAHTEQTHIEVLPSSMAYEAGDEFSVAVMLHLAKAATSFAVHIAYDEATLAVKEITPDEESFPFWWTQEAADGLLELEASAPTPGLSGDIGVALITFEATESGTSEFTVQDTSLVLNAQNENILLPEQEEQQEQPTQPASQDQVTGGQQTGNMNMGLLVGGLIVVAVGGGIVFLLLRKK